MDPSDSATAPSTRPDQDDTVELRLRLAAHPVHPAPVTHAVSCRETTSILALKQQLFDEWDGKPKPDGITLIKGGRVCRDSETLDEATPRTELVLHVVVRASAWSAPFTSPPPPPIATPVLPTINTTPPSPLPSPPQDQDSPARDEEMATSGYSPAYVSPVPSTSTPAPVPAPTPPATSATAPSSTSNNPYLVYLGHLQRLIPIQRSLLLLNLQKAHHYYQLQVQQRTLALEPPGDGPGNREDGGGVEELAEVESLLKECGLWHLVRKREDQVGEAQAVRNEEDDDQRPNEEFKVVQLDGLPYLLHTPRALQRQRPKPSLAALQSLSRAESILKILTTLLQLLITFQPSSPSVAHGRSLLSRSNGTANPSTAILAGGGPQQDLNALAAAAGVRLPGQQPPAHPPLPLPHHHHRAARRAATISITLHIDSLVQFLVPLFFLSVKLAFLLFIFARHASPTKRSVLIGMAVAWVLWEGVRIARRRRPQAGAGPEAGVDPGEGAGRDRDRERDWERRRMARDLAQQAQAQAPEEAQARGPVPNDPPAHDHAAQAAPIAAPARRRPRDVPPANPVAAAPRREPPSVFSPKYWINSLAAVGLVSEARELGLSPRYIAGRPIASARARPSVARADQTRWDRHRVELRRLARIVWIGAVLFVATLVPEIERKRKKALEKRERLLAEKKVRWEREREKEERERERRNDAANPAAVASGVEGRGHGPGDTGVRRKLAGRDKVSDEELFRDGTSEAFASSTSAAPVTDATPSTSTSTQPSAPTASSSSRLAPSTPAAAPEGMPDSTLGALADEDDPNLSPDDEGDGDIAASASVSDNSDDEEGPELARGPEGHALGDDGDRGEREADGGIVAIF
ncbi:hypothetical protein JCM11491_007226 [Sporobolomyces phaffii]